MLYNDDDAEADESQNYIDDIDKNDEVAKTRMITVRTENITTTTKTK